MEPASGKKIDDDDGRTRSSTPLVVVDPRLHLLGRELAQRIHGARREVSAKTGEVYVVLRRETQLGDLHGDVIEAVATHDHVDPARIETVQDARRPIESVPAPGKHYTTIRDEVDVFASSLERHTFIPDEDELRRVKSHASLPLQLNFHRRRPDPRDALGQ